LRLLVRPYHMQSRFMNGIDMHENGVVGNFGVPAGEVADKPPDFAGSSFGGLIFCVGGPTSVDAKVLRDAGVIKNLFRS
jgi:hypothetical protein